METYFENLSAKEGSSRKLVQDLGVLVRDTESLLGSYLDDFAEKSRTDIKRQMRRLKSSYQQFEDNAALGARQADRLIRRKPLHAVGIAFAVGLLIGFCRRSQGET